MTTKTVDVTAYQSLLLDFTPRPISTQSQYKRVMRQIDKLIKKCRLSRAEEDFLELLSTLIVQYESRVYPAPKVSPGEMLAHLIEARGVTRAEVARETGIAQSTITNAINGTRGISKANITNLAAYFHVSPTAFIAGAE